MMDKPSFEDSVERLLRGERAEDLARGDQERERELGDLQRLAHTLRRAAGSEPSDASTRMALARTLGEVEAVAARPRGLWALRWLHWLSALLPRPLALSATAVIGALFLLAGAGIGASAARGGAPAPVRAFIRMFDEAGRHATATPARTAGTSMDESNSAEGSNAHGNTHFATPTNQAPYVSETGQRGEQQPARPNAGAGTATPTPGGVPTPPPGPGQAITTDTKPRPLVPIDGAPVTIETPTPGETPTPVDTPTAADTPVPVDTPTPTATETPFDVDSPSPTETPPPVTP
jgi:hypothetical protein